MGYTFSTYDEIRPQTRIRNTVYNTKQKKKTGEDEGDIVLTQRDQHEVSRLCASLANNRTSDQTKIQGQLSILSFAVLIHLTLHRTQLQRKGAMSTWYTGGGSIGSPSPKSRSGRGLSDAGVPGA